MYKNIIFDFGQVIVSFDPMYMTSIYIDDENTAKKASQIIFDRLYWDRLDNGTICDEEVKAGIHSRMPQELHDVCDKIYDNWMYNTPLIEGMKELILKLKGEGAKLYLLSNISCGFAENYKSIPEVAEVLSLFDGLTFSGPLGLVKPQREIFEHLLSVYGLKAEECIFIDDSEKNLKGAENIGINTLLFRGDAKEIEKELLK